LSFFYILLCFFFSSLLHCCTKATDMSANLDKGPVSPADSNSPL
jgi:hypothetical protein